MNKVNMMNLAGLLKSIPEYQFYMDFWFSDIEIDNDTAVKYDFITVGEVKLYPNNESRFVNKIEDGVNINHHCSTAACIAGWAVALRDNFEEIELDRYSWNVRDSAAQYLGLTNHQANQLFFFGSDTLWCKYQEEFAELSDLEFDEWGGDEIGKRITNTVAARMIEGLVTGIFEFEAEYN